MAKVYAQLDDRLTKFILAQPIFFVATAPTASADGGGGHVNVSPKGYRDTFAIIGPRTVAYLDLTGSGAETIAHLRQNGRITIMFCSFDRTPKILRLYGSGRVVLPADRDWPRFAACFAGHRAQAANAQAANAQAASGRAPRRLPAGLPAAGLPAARLLNAARTAATGGRSSWPSWIGSPIPAGTPCP